MFQNMVGDVRDVETWNERRRLEVGDLETRNERRILEMIELKKR
jgi:hypothetical protein